jgi:trk system potassium uptake protein TrkA
VEDVRIIIAGCGTLGRRVASYTKDKHDVVIVEKNGERARAIEDELGVKVIVGDADEPGVLEEAGIARADVFLASTGHDEDNLVASLLAKNEFKVKKVIAAVRNPRNRWLYNRSWGVDVAIDSAQIVSRLIEEEATLADIVTLLSLREGEVTVTALSVTAEAWAAGRTMSEVEIPEGCVVAALLHDTEIITPTPETTIQIGDVILFIARPGAECEITDKMG